MLSKAPADSRLDPSPLLVVALSGRALASSARRGGYPVVVLDLYNDVDTRSCAVQTRRVPGTASEFDREALLSIAHEFARATSGLVAGAGFEAAPALIEQLADGSPLYGNSPEVVARVKEPDIFFALLDALDIPHPETSCTPPREPEGWLVKRTGGQGGTHIRPAAPGMTTDPGHYFQRYQPGCSASVLFLADGIQARIVGFNEQFSPDVNGARYWYSGAINRAELAPILETEIGLKLNALVRATGLIGLNSLDFLIQGSRYSVLEVNPRPSATMDLHDADHPSGLFHLHLLACQGRLPERMPDSGTVRAHAVVYAAQLLSIPAWFRFPAWCSDLPEAGSHFEQGAPVCMVHASGSSVAEVKRLLAHRQAMIEAAILEEAA